MVELESSYSWDLTMYREEGMGRTRGRIGKKRMMRGRRLHPLDKENRDKAELIEGKLCVRMRL